MQIKNFLTDNIEELEEFIIKELCKNGIQYTYIKESHEIHFDQYIFRFFDYSIIFKISQNEITLPIIDEEIIEHKISGFSDFLEKQKLRPTYHNPNINKILKLNKNTKNVKYNPKRFK